MKISREDMLVIYKKLPQQIKDYLATAESIDLVFSIGEKQGLTSEQILTMSKEVTSILYGLTPIGDLEKNLNTALQITSDKIKLLADDIRKNILSGLEKYVQKNELPIDVNILRKQHRDTEGEFKNHISKLPEQVQQFISSGEFRKILDGIGVEFDLRPSKLIDLKNETLFVLVGLEKKSNFEKNVLENLGLPKEMTLKMARAIDSVVFSKFEQGHGATTPKPTPAPGSIPQIQKAAHSEAPINLPTEHVGQKVPEFAKPTETPAQNSDSTQTLTEIKVQRDIPARSKPANAFLEKQEEQPAKGLSQQDVLESRQTKPRPEVVPTRQYTSYKDEKIGGVSIEKEKEDEIDENIDREALLRDIENPTETKTLSSGPVRNNYKGTDPYREPIE